MSISSSTSLSPDEIARKSFAAVRKGVDGEAVRTFLAKVAAELREVLEREAVVRERLAEAERSAADPVLDEATLTRAIGIETAKILSTAHEAAHNVVAKAEERAAELIGESERVLGEQVAKAQSEALAIRMAAEQEAEEYSAQAHAEADAFTAEAHADAVELLDATKEECRRMVAEARDLRNRTLADLVSRRGALRVQLEELRGGKDSLLGVVESVAVAVDALRQRLASAEDQARIAAEEAGERVELQPGHDELVELEAELAATAEALADVTLAPSEDASPEVAPPGEQAEGETPRSSGEDAGTEDGEDHLVSSASRRSVDELFARIRASRAAEEAAAVALAVEPLVDEAEQTEPAGNLEPAVIESADVGDQPQEELEVGPEPVGTAMPAGEVQRTGEMVVVVLESVTSTHESVVAEVIESPEFDDAEVGAGSLQGDPAASTDTPGPSGAKDTTTEESGSDQAPALEAEVVLEAKSLDSDAITEPDVESLARRDHLLGAVTAKLSRALKRALQDDQNELLNALRQTSHKPVLDDLVPPDLQRKRFVQAASDQLARAYEAGAAFLVTGDSVEGPSVSAPPPSEMSTSEAGTALAVELADDLSGMLRLRIEEALAELDGSLEGAADAAGVAYREWKGSRVEGLAGDFTTRAFAAGELAVLESVGNGGAPLVRWAVEDDDGGGSCPDCDDNSLAGPLLPGTAFPTGHSQPPVHPGCRCLLVPVRS